MHLLFRNKLDDALLLLLLSQISLKLGKQPTFLFTPCRYFHLSRETMGKKIHSFGGHRGVAAEDLLSIAKCTEKLVIHEMKYQRSSMVIWYQTVLENSRSLQPTLQLWKVVWYRPYLYSRDNTHTQATPPISLR